MTELLKKAINSLEQLPASEQDAIAQQILEELQEEDRWEASFNDPRSEIVLDHLITRQGTHGARQIQRSRRNPMKSHITDELWKSTLRLATALLLA